MSADTYPQPQIPRQHRAKPSTKACTAAWYLRPLYSRGEYSPRLTAAWATLLFTFWLIRRWVTFEPKVMAGILLQAPQVGEVVGILIALVAALFGLGTLTKVKLDGPPPTPDTQINADTAPVNTNSVNMATPGTDSA